MDTIHSQSRFEQVIASGQTSGKGTYCYNFLHDLFILYFYILQRETNQKSTFTPSAYERHWGENSERFPRIDYGFNPNDPNVWRHPVVPVWWILYRIQEESLSLIHI